MTIIISVNSIKYRPQAVKIEGKDKTMKLYRITLIEKNNIRTIRTWAKSETELKKDIKRLLPLSTIENITEITFNTLKIDR